MSTVPTKIVKGLLSPKARVEEAFQQAISHAFPLLDADACRPIISTSNPRFGDYQCNNAMSLLKGQKEKVGEYKSPKEIGMKIEEELKNKHCGEDKMFKTVTTAPQGFVTVALNENWLVQELKKMERIECKVERSLKCGVDYSSPNIAKEMHVGHLRTTIHGEAICRILEFVGHEVTRINHVGDWGTQFGMLIVHLEEKFPTFRQNPPHLSDLNEFYKDAKKRFDADPEFKTRARQKVVELQSGEPSARKAWQLLVKLSMSAFQEIYDRLGVSLELRGESFYNDMLPGVIKMCEDKGMVEVCEGAKCIFTNSERGKHEGDVPLILVKSDGGYGYDSTDVATVYHRTQLAKYNVSIYITDTGQGDHFVKIFKCAEMMGWWDRSKADLVHVGVGLVCGEDGKKFKTREGSVVKLVSLLDEARDRAKQEIIKRRSEEEEEDSLRKEEEDSLRKEKEEGKLACMSKEELESASQRLGYAAVKYFDLKQVRTGSYKFSFDKMLDPKGNTAVYMFYAYARICAIFRKTERKPDLNLLEITQPAERQLALCLLKLAQVLETILADYCCHRLCEYMYELSTSFTEFYSTCRVINSPQEPSRLAFCLLTRQMLSTCFHLLGISPLERI